ncbi:MAG: hypothetical protein IJR28_05305 [Ottowia sp.]|nr:hypothetical protein [Ottowia sp.]
MSQHLRLRPATAAQGLRWVGDGLRLWRRQPLVLTGLFLMLLMALTLLAALPFVGGTLASVLMPACNAGLMCCAQAVQQGRWPHPAMLLAAWRRSPQHTRAMLTLGLLYAAAMLLLAVLWYWLDDGALTQLLVAHGGRVTPELLQEPQFPAAFRSALHRLALMAVVYLPIAVLFWLAPALVYWHNTPPAKALFFSATAVLRNASAYLAFAFGWLGVFLFAGFALALLAALPGIGTVAIALTMPVCVCLVAALVVSIWSTFLGSFTPEPPPV